MTGKEGMSKAFELSRKYVDWTQARVQDGVEATATAVVTGGQQLPGLLWKRFLAGLKVVIPVAVTLFIVVWVFTKIDGLLQPVIQYAMGRNIPGLGFGVTVLVIIIAGVVVSNVATRKLFSHSEYLVSKIPLIRHLYSGIKQITDSFSADSNGRFMKVVLVEFPKKGMTTLGFVTNEVQDDSGKTYLNVFIPTAPNPTSGFLQIIPEADVVHTTISPDAALKMIVSAGKVSAKDLSAGLGRKVADIEDLEMMLEKRDKTGETAGPVI